MLNEQGRMRQYNFAYLFCVKTSWLNVFTHSCGMNARSCRGFFLVFVVVVVCERIFDSLILNINVLKSFEPFVLVPFTATLWFFVGLVMVLLL
jgi:hypothetical protein